MFIIFHKLKYMKFKCSLETVTIQISTERQTNDQPVSRSVGNGPF